MDTYNKTKEAYDEIREVMVKHRDTVLCDTGSLDEKASKHLFGIELQEKYGFDIKLDEVCSTDYFNLRGYMRIGLFGEKTRRTISWSDDGKQPENEYLLNISFPTGAYIFGDDYPTELFQQFFLELKSYNPKYSDTTNKNLYFTLESGSKVFNEFRTIINKYFEINKTDSRERKIKKLQGELEKLNNAT